MEQYEMLPATLVLVTDQFACERIIHASRVVADLTHTRLIVLSVMRDGVPTNPMALEHLFKVAKEYGAQMTVEFSDSPKNAISHYIRVSHAGHVVTGLPENEDSLLVKLWRAFPNTGFFTVGEQGELHEVVDRTCHRQFVQVGLEGMEAMVREGGCMD